MLIGGYSLSRAHVYLSRAHPDVYLAELLITRPELKSDLKNLDIQAFLQSGKSMDELVESAKSIRKKYHVAGWITGGFLGLVLGMMLLNQMVFRKRTDYITNKTNCFSCGRCIDYCPVGKEIKL
jgi:NAD-dependent dihydropyrimidine dehydrogenase PreA subunit